MKFISRKFALVTEPENNHSDSQYRFPLPLNGYNDWCKQFHGVNSAKFISINSFEYVLYCLSFIREYIHFVM